MSHNAYNHSYNHHNDNQVDNANPPIVLADAQQGALLRQLVIACPAGLYLLQADGSLHFDVQGCLECGTCRLLCGAEAFTRWRYPDDGKGIEFRFG
ncbi:ferredoxin family protein [Serratia sp. S1B]|nr:ferredoxin family protein [Serratia sp. S1B]